MRGRSSHGSTPAPPLQLGLGYVHSSTSAQVWAAQVDKESNVLHTGHPRAKRRKMPDVLMLCKAFPPATGGVENYSEQVALAYLRQGLDVTVVTQHPGTPGWAMRHYEDGDVSVFNTGPGGQLRTAAAMAAALAKLLPYKRNFEFVHATTWRPAVALVAAPRPIPLVVTVHGREILAIPAFLRPLMYAVFRRTTLVIAVSFATQARARDRLGRTFRKSNWVVAHNGITHEAIDPDLHRRTPSPLDDAQTEPVRFFTLARLVERKNIQACVEAFATLKTSGVHNFEYRIAGTGPLADALRVQIREAGLDAYVQLLGYVDDSEVPKLYYWADVFLHPQIELDNGDDFEGFGLSIADAMSYGCLAIAGDGSGPSDFIDNGRTGVLVDGSNREHVRHVIQSVITNRESYLDLARAGQEYVTRELSWDRHAKRILESLHR